RCGRDRRIEHRHHLLVRSPVRRQRTVDRHGPVVASASPRVLDDGVQRGPEESADRPDPRVRHCGDGGGVRVAHAHRAEAMRLMYDAITPEKIPPTAVMVAGY